MPTNPYMEYTETGLQYALQLAMQGGTSKKTIQQMLEALAYKQGVLMTSRQVNKEG